MSPAYRLTGFGQLIRSAGPMDDGVFLDLAPALAPEFPGTLDSAGQGESRRKPRPLAVRIAEEEARLARRLDQHADAGLALARVIPHTTPDRAAAMLRPADADRQTWRMYAALRRYVAAQRRVDLAHSRVVLSRARLNNLKAQEETA